MNTKSYSLLSKLLMYINNVSWIISINDVVFLENVRKNRQNLVFLVSRRIFIHVEIWLRISNVLFSREDLLCFVLHAMYAHWNSIRVAFFLKNFLFLHLNATILDNKCELNSAVLNNPSQPTYSRTYFSWICQFVAEAGSARKPD